MGDLHPGAVARRAPERPAVVMGGSGTVVTYADLDAAADRLARALWSCGLRPGDHLALLSENHPRVFEVAWAALRSGLYCTPISTASTVDEAAYVVADCGARAVVLSAGLGPLAAGVAGAVDVDVDLRLAAGGPVDGCRRYEEVVAAAPDEPRPEPTEGSMMLYSSGTTGRPKGVKRPLSGRPPGTSNPLGPFLPHVGLGDDTVYLSAAPLYHAAPLGWSLGTQRMGGTVVVMERFDPVDWLRLVEEHRVTHAQVVPTMLTRLLRLPADVRAAHDLSSLRLVLHAGAPCPVPVKRAAIEWLGPIVDEYYSGTEGSGITYVTSAEWLERPGTVGRPILGHVHVVGDDGTEVPAGEVGTVYFSSGERYEYHNDPAATARRVHDRTGWTTLDDMGFVDGDGHLFLTDRRAHMIVTGGVNVSPAEVEAVLLEHPAVDDAAVIGVPDEEFGEAVKAVVVLAPAAGLEAPAVEPALVAWCRERLAGLKCPRSVDVVDELPRNEAGKLLKRVLREPYWEGHESRVV